MNFLFKKSKFMKILLVIWSFVIFIFNSLAQNPFPKSIPVVNGSWWQIADEDYDAGIYSNKPKYGEATLPIHQQINDFTIFKAANGKWQLVASVRNTNFPGGKHFIMRWESDRLTTPNWKEKGVFKTTKDFPIEAKYNEGVLYAPHCVKDNNKYYLFHNSGTSYVLISDDGINFNSYKKPDGSYSLFDIGEAGRDLMILDNRMRDNLWYFYYVSIDRNRPEIENRQFSDVFVRTSKNILGPWSEPHAAGMGIPNRPRSIVHSAYDFVNSESPFVIYHEDFYFKFEQTFVVASADPANFEGKPVVTNMFPNYKYPEEWWPALAPEVVVDGNKMYIAYFLNHNAHPFGTLKQGGVFMAEIIWKPFDK